MGKREQFYKEKRESPVLKTFFILHMTSITLIKYATEASLSPPEYDQRKVKKKGLRVT